MANNLLHLQKFILFFLMRFVTSSASSCDCHTVSDWESLRTLVFSPSAAKTITGMQEHLVLCPFDITKSHDENTNHWDTFIPINKPIHIQCMKNKSSDTCSVEIVGPTCGFEQNCGRGLFKIKSDNVWLEGLTIKKAKDNVIMVGSGAKGVKLIDMTFVGNQVPGADDYSPAAIVQTGYDSSLQIIKSGFYWNKATPVHNRGKMIIVSTDFNNNQGTKVNKISDSGAVHNRGQLVLSGNTFQRNFADKGSAITSMTMDVHDIGGNCGFQNLSTDLTNCDGVMFDSNCYAFTSNGQCSLV